jgi:hypothetical protein
VDVASAFNCGVAADSEIGLHSPSSVELEPGMNNTYPLSIHIIQYPRTLRNINCILTAY